MFTSILTRHTHKQVRRSSYTEDQTSFKKKLENGGLIKKGEGETGDSSPSPALEEPMAPGGPKRVVSSKNQFSGMLAPQKKTPVILNSKPVFSNLHKKRDERKDEVASLSTSSTPVPGASEGGGKREGSSATTG